MITIEIKGGLGNQLFQIFTLISYSLQHKNAFYFEDKEPTDGPRKINYWNNFLIGFSKFVKPILLIDNYIREHSYHYCELPPTDVKRISKLNGYYQSYKYFDNNKLNIIKFMKFDHIRKPYENMYDFDHTISMHFRLGDYKALQEHHPILNLNYYIKSLQYIIETTLKSNWQVLYVFEQEDIRQVEENINILSLQFPTISFLAITGCLSDWEQLIMLSLCKHNIIANSTFSWWGAYLNNKNGTVCYPTTWFGPAQGKKNLGDLFPTTWHRIDE